MVIMFKREREVVADAAATAKRSINTSLVVASAAVVIALVALVAAVIGRG